MRKAKLPAYERFPDWNELQRSPQPQTSFATKASYFNRLHAPVWWLGAAGVVTDGVAGVGDLTSACLRS